MLHLLEDAADRLEDLAHTPHVALVLDFDGTIAPFAPTPEAARIEPEAEAALRRLRARAGRRVSVGVASGRRIEDLRRRLPPLDFWIGLHGLELALRSDPGRLRFDPGPSDQALERLRWQLRDGLRHGGRIEDKQHSIALHVRGLDSVSASAAITEFTRLVENERASGAPLESLAGHLVVEARPTAAGKHRAIAEVLRLLNVPALCFVGDDETDEEVFRAFPDALTVVVMDPPHASEARYRLRSPAETVDLLSRFTAIFESA